MVRFGPSEDILKTTTWLTSSSEIRKIIASLVPVENKTLICSVISLPAGVKYMENLQASFESKIIVGLAHG